MKSHIWSRTWHVVEWGHVTGLGYYVFHITNASVIFTYFFPPLNENQFHFILGWFIDVSEVCAYITFTHFHPSKYKCLCKGFSVVQRSEIFCWSKASTCLITSSSDNVNGVLLQWCELSRDREVTGAEFGYLFFRCDQCMCVYQILAHGDWGLLGKSTDDVSYFIL